MADADAPVERVRPLLERVVQSPGLEGAVAAGIRRIEVVEIRYE